MAPPSVLSLLLLPLTITLFQHHVAILVSGSEPPIRCRSGWTGAIKTVPPSQINDGYCDCPFDGLDEPGTGACSGSTDGMWAGIPTKHTSSDRDAARPAAAFACPQQPSLLLPPSRVGDGICDCCDGADESTSAAACSDICDEVMEGERMARDKARFDYEVGSAKRLASVAQYREWQAEAQDKLHRLRNVDLVAVDAEMEGVKKSLMDARVFLARHWLAAVNNGVLAVESPLMEVVGNDAMSLDDLASFIVSLCWLSAEASMGNIADDRCLALDRASLDLGILWNYSSIDDGSDALPSFDRLDAGKETVLIDLADKIMLRLEEVKNDRTARNASQKRKSKTPSPDYDSSDDPYGDDWEDRHDYDYDYDDDYIGDENYQSGEEDVIESQTKEEDEAKKEKQKPMSANKLVVKSLLEKVPLDRDLFKVQGNLLLRYTPKVPEDSDDPAEGEAEESLSEDEGADDKKEEEELNSVGSGIDPMALRMVKSTISKRLSNIARGETSGESAARFVASIMENKDSALMDLKNLAIMTIYHSKLALGDVAELVYSASGNLRLTETLVDENESSCSASLSTICPPHTVQSGKKVYPPAFIVEAAQERCEQRENSLADVCTVQEGDGIKFPNTVPDGYYNYYLPESRSPDDGLVPFFSSLDSLQKIPSNILDLRKQKVDVDKRKKSLKKNMADIEHEIGDDSGGGSLKYGVDGELYIIRDTCHKIESGKYEYEVCIFGKATQRDIGQKSGGTNLGSWRSVDNMEDGTRKMMWVGGTKCWNGPVRSAEVSVACGADTKLLTADEPDTCRYVFNMESPIGCDEQFKARSML